MHDNLIANLICLLIIILVFEAYHFATVLTGRKSYSYSDSFHKWKGWKGVWFILMTWGISLPVFLIIDWSILGWHNIFFLVGALSMMFIGVWAEFSYNPTSSFFHNAFSYISIMSYLLAFVFMFGWWYAIPLGLYLIAALYIKLKKGKHGIWYQEWLAFHVIAIEFLVAILLNS